MYLFIQAGSHASAPGLNPCRNLYPSTFYCKILTIVIVNDKLCTFRHVCMVDVHIAYIFMNCPTMTFNVHCAFKYVIIMNKGECCHLSTCRCQHMQLW